MKKQTAKHRPLHSSRKFKYDGFAITAFWQLMSFLLLILLIWVNEVLDLSNLWFGIHPEDPNFYKGCVLTVGVMVIAIVTVGHTYLQQKKIISGFIIICSNCRKMRMDEYVWDHLDQYVADHSMSKISHGLCPDCYELAKREVGDITPPVPLAKGTGDKK